MKKKQLLSLFMISLLAINNASASIISLKNGLSYTHTEDKDNPLTKQEKLEIAETITKIQKDAFDTGFTSTSGEGTQIPGDKGMSLGMAYLTPKMQFGYTGVSDFYIGNGDGLIKSYSDPLALSESGWGIPNGQKWATTNWANIEVYDIGVAYFNKQGMKDTIDVNKANLSIDNLKNYLVQENINNDGTYKDSNKKKFIATTLYTRWYYDTDPTSTHPSYGGTGYTTANPILSTSETGGPYLAINNYFDMSMDVAKNSSYRNTIRNNKSRFLVSMNTLVNKGATGFPSAGTNFSYFNYESPFQDVLNVAGKKTNRAVLEKRFEYRLYINDNGGTIEEKAYEFLYGYEKEEIVNQSAIPNKQPNVSIKVEPINPDPTGKTSTYKVSTTIIGLNPTYSSPSSEKSYTVYADAGSSANKSVNDASSSALKNEPKETELDMWHTGIPNGSGGYNGLIGKITFTSPDGKKSFTENNIPVGENIKRTITSPYGDLSNWTAVLSVDYSLHGRYMYEKNIYTDVYKKNTNTNETLIYNDAINYILSLADGDTTSYTKNVNTYHSKVARTVYKYKTDSISRDKDNNYLNVEAKTHIFGTSSNSIDHFKEPLVTVNRTPENPTTQLEGGTFEVDGYIDGLETTLPDDLKYTTMEYTVADRNQIPGREQSFAEWHDNIAITKFVITAPDGEKWVEIDTAKGDPPITSDVRNTVDVILSKQHLSAKPTQVGKAHILIEYEYTYNYRTENHCIESDKLKLDANGNLVPEEYYVTYETKSYSKTGSWEDYFNIYSVSGVTVN